MCSQLRLMTLILIARTKIINYDKLLALATYSGFALQNPLLEHAFVQRTLDHLVIMDPHCRFRDLLSYSALRIEPNQTNFSMLSLVRLFRLIKMHI